MSDNMQVGKPHICPVCRSQNSLVDDGGNWKCKAYVGDQMCGHEIPKVYVPNTLDASATFYSQRKPSLNAMQDAQLSGQDFTPEEVPAIHIKHPHKKPRLRFVLIALCVAVILFLLILLVLR